MPGRVVRLMVEEGDAVEAQQGILVIEAMKMLNELFAPKAGRVIELRVSAGETVATGQVLAIID
jgi:biotin carboxyl carrier protein